MAMALVDGVRREEDFELNDHHTPNCIERPMPYIASSFKRLHSCYLAESLDIEVKQFAVACDYISVLFNHLGVAFSFGGKDYIEKVKALHGAAEHFQTLPDLLEHDIKEGTVRIQGSHSRNLLRVKRGLDMNRCIFLSLLNDSKVSLKDCAMKAYEKVFAPYHSWGIRKVVTAGMFALPTKQGFLKRLRENEASWTAHAEEYVVYVDPIISYIDNLFISRKLGVDW